LAGYTPQSAQWPLRILMGWRYIFKGYSNQEKFVTKLLRFGLLACCAYFVCMAIAHFFGIKLPILFVYYDTPYHAYQDKIISFAVLAYVGLFFAASRDIAIVPIALIVLAMTVLGLVSVNLSDALASVLVEGQAVWPYWAQTGLIAAIWLALTVLYLGRSKS
jgi:hypothetical protein